MVAGDYHGKGVGTESALTREGIGSVHHQFGVDDILRRINGRHSVVESGIVDAHVIGCIT